MANSVKQFLGAMAWVRTAPTSGTQVTVTAMRGIPINPTNQAYPSVVNSSSYPSVTVSGKKSPRVALSMCAHSTWFTAANLNDLIQTLDSEGDTPDFAVCLYENSTLTYNNYASAGRRVYDGSKCESISIFQNAMGGPIGVEVSFVSKYGDSEQTTPTTFTSFATLSGNLFSVANVTFGTATLVRSWRLNLFRGQGHVYFLDGTLYPSEVASGMFSGSLTLEQSPKGVAPSTSEVVTVASGPVFTMTNSLKLDDRRADLDIGLGNVLRAYTLFNTSGGNPCVIS